MKAAKTIWIAGRWPEDSTWEVLGTFDTEREARAACYDDRCFVGAVPHGQPLGREATPWPGAHYPAR